MIKNIKEKFVNDKLKVIHFPNIPCDPFEVEVRNEIEASLLVQTLAKQHLWLYENKFIPDYSNIIFVEMYDDTEEEWVEYWNYSEDMIFDEFEQAYILEPVKV